MILLLLIFGAQALAATSLFWQKKPDIAGDVVGDDPGGENKPSGPTRPKGSSSRPRSRTLSTLSVTFLTDLPDAQILRRGAGSSWLPLGKVGADGSLVVRLPRGSHAVAASHAGYPLQPQQIEVQPGRTTFTFSFTGRAVTARPRGASSDPASVLARYMNPAQTHTVTLADWQAVLSQTSTTLAQDPANVQAKAQQLFAQGQLAYLRRDYPGAVVAFNSAALVKSDSALSYLGLGNAYLATGQLSEASRAYQRALELNPDLGLAYRGMGDVLSKQGKSKDALAYYDRATAKGLNSGDLSFERAVNVVKEKGCREGLRLLTELAQTKPSANIFIQVGDCYRKQNQPLSASQAYQKATELDNRSAAGYAKYGETMYGMREYTAAKEALERALALDPTGTQIDPRRTRKMADEASKKISKTP